MQYIFMTRNRVHPTAGHSFFSRNLIIVLQGCGSYPISPKITDVIPLGDNIFKTALKSLGTDLRLNLSKVKLRRAADFYK